MGLLYKICFKILIWIFIGCVLMIFFLVDFYFYGSYFFYVLLIVRYFFFIELWSGYSVFLGLIG